METAERRYEMLKILCRRRNETTKNLAAEFGVSERTVRRDIYILSLSEPIYTQPGRNGGIYVVDSYYWDRMYMSDEQIGLLQKLLSISLTNGSKLLNADEISLLKKIISEYSKPEGKKGEQK